MPVSHSFELPDFQSVVDSMASVRDQIVDYATDSESVLQFAVALAMTLAAFAFSRRYSKRIKRLDRQRRFSFATIAPRLHVGITQLLFLLLWPLLLWLAAMIMQASGQAVPLLQGLAGLVLAWTLIRLSSGLIQNALLSKVLAISIWVIAALNFLGWLDTVTTTLDEAAITLGTFRLSLLIGIKALLTFGLLIWLSNFFSSVAEQGFQRSHSLTSSQQVLFSKLARIALLAVSILIGLNVLGIDLTALAVFSGALGIGIGFGLQKVFSNLVSGFILLMDKSIKPGDVIAVGDTFGWVNRLSARYVSIITRDGKEHLIPNEHLITEQVENWSYSDENIRIHVPIGVSYDSDITLVKELLLKAAQDHPRILDNPKPICLINGFGDNSVDFEIRAWIDDPVNGISNVQSHIYEAVWFAFKKNNIEIPFPQRDIHVRSWSKPND